MPAPRLGASALSAYLAQLPPGCSKLALPAHAALALRCGPRDMPLGHPFACLKLILTEPFCLLMPCLQLIVLRVFLFFKSRRSRALFMCLLMLGNDLKAWPCVVHPSLQEQTCCMYQALPYYTTYCMTPEPSKV